MASTFPGYEYDIFISYRQKDNRYDGWVTEFVSNLKKELEAISKEDLNVYFDINPHNGLLESHDVGDSLKEKLKCIIFIPVISRTYCDPKSFAWEHEFKAFLQMASLDKFGLKVKLPGGNVASRILPVRIYDLNKEDIELFESVLGGPLRAVEFIYKSAGVNRPLRANEDHSHENLNKTYYRDQINKLAHSVQEILDGLRLNSNPVTAENDKRQSQVTQSVPKTIVNMTQSTHRKPGKKVLVYALSALLLIASSFAIKHMLSGKQGISGLTSEEVLNKACSIYDPTNDWKNRYDGRIKVTCTTMSAEYDWTNIIEIDNATGYWRTRASDRKEGWSVKNGEYYKFKATDDNSAKDELVKDSMLLRRIENEEMHDRCLFGLPMELKNSGLVLDKKITIKKFQGYDCLVLTFVPENSKVHDNYFKGVTYTLFLDPSNYSLKGYSVRDPKNNKDFYCILAGTVIVHQQIIPMCRIFYNGSDNSFLSVEVVTPAI